MERVCVFCELGTVVLYLINRTNARTEERKTKQPNKQPTDRPTNSVILWNSVHDILIVFLASQ